jgi:hypothetical protein
VPNQGSARVLQKERNPAGMRDCKWRDPDSNRGTPRFSVVSPSLLSLAHCRDFRRFLGGRPRRCFAALCGRLRCERPTAGSVGLFVGLPLLQARHIVGAAAAADYRAPLQPRRGDGRHKRFGSFESCAMTSCGIWTFRRSGSPSTATACSSSPPRAGRICCCVSPPSSSRRCRGLTGRPHCLRRRSCCDRRGPADKLRRVVAGAVSSD